MKIRAIDCETTGLGREARPVQIGSVDFRDNGTVYGERLTIVDPKCKITDGATRVHGLTNADVKGAPTIKQAMTIFRGADIYIMHNAPFDWPMLSPYLPGAFDICTYSCSVQAWPGLPSYKLWDVHTTIIGPPEGKPHTALDDAKVTASLFKALARVAKLDTLYAWTHDPKFYEIMPVGKYQGIPIADICNDPDGARYFIKYWLVPGGGGIPGLKSSIKHWMEVCNIGGTQEQAAPLAEGSQVLAPAEGSASSVGGFSFSNPIRENEKLRNARRPT